MLACEIPVTDSWFIPHFPARTDRPYEMAMQKTWKQVMSYEDHYGGMWSSRIASLLADIPRAQNERSSRVAASFALWLMTNNGGSFLDSLFKHQNQSSFFFNEDSVAITLWALENRNLSLRINPLEILLRDEYGKPVYSDPPYPTLEDNRVVEYFTCYFITDEGKKLLQKVYSRAKIHVTSRHEVRSLPFT